MSFLNDSSIHDVFYGRYPVVPTQCRVFHGNAKEDPMHSKLRVLSIDREYLIALDVESILKSRFDCDVDIASFETALSVLSRGRYHVVVINVDEPPDLVLRITRKALTAESCLIYTTTGCTTRNHGSYSGSVNLLQKPINEEKLFSAYQSLACFQSSGHERA